ncbi:MAG TPA: 2-amino-4-hydroxy-6-hydroxymethyldihydropteridine diphosphokinase, partial [Rubrivivax sp.]|nr:2-amino-4-hydroxy-6-hydroxymethyldihydropteridine diphosphokinase [Rubrivivax sp.]
MSGERVFVGLGANLGDARAAVLIACQQLATLPGSRLVAQSALYRSAPVDAQGPDFCNAVAELRTSVDPQGLLQMLQAIE